MDVELDLDSHDAALLLWAIDEAINMQGAHSAEEYTHNVPLLEALKETCEFQVRQWTTAVFQSESQR